MGTRVKTKAQYLSAIGQKPKTTRTMRSFSDGVRRGAKATEIMGKEGRAIW